MAIKYKWLADRLKEMIFSYIEKGIEKLPTEQELCERFRVSRQTVRLSLSLLEEEGLIVKRQGSGSYITGLLSEPESNIIGILISDDQDYIYPGLINDIQTELSRALSPSETERNALPFVSISTTMFAGFCLSKVNSL